MQPKQLRILLPVAIAILAVTIALLAFPSPNTPIYEQVLIFFALFGFMFLSLTTLTLPFVKEFVQAFGKSFLSVHHAFAVLGLVFITVHPVLYAIESLSALVLLPQLSSFFVFWAFAGSPAIIILYTALVAALLRRKAVHHWKPFHMLVYITLLFGIIHANLLGRSFFVAGGSLRNMGIVTLFDALFAVSIVGLLFKQYQSSLLRKKMQAKLRQNPQNNSSSNKA